MLRLSVKIYFSLLTTTDLEWIISSLIRRPIRRNLEKILRASSSYLPWRDHLYVESISGKGEIHVELSFNEGLIEEIGEEGIINSLREIFSRKGDGVREVAENMRKNITGIEIRLLKDGSTLMNIEIYGKEVKVDGKRVYPESEQKTLEDIFLNDFNNNLK